MELNQLLNQYRAAPAQALADQIMETLAGAQIYIPAAADKHVVPVQGNLMGLKPDTIPAGEGKVLFPVFSDPSQVPDEYGARFTFLHMDFDRFAKAAAADPRFAGIIIDPFTSRFMLAGK
jgi:hypothetical protein